MRKIKISEDLAWEQKKSAIELSFINGFFSESAEFPITSREDGIDPDLGLLKLREEFNFKQEAWPEGYVSSTKSAREIPDLDWRKKKGLESIMDRGMFLEDKNLDLLADSLNFKFKIDEDASLDLVEAACNLAFRFAMETTGFEGSLLADKDYRGNILYLKEADETALEFIEEDSRIIVQLSGRGRELLDFTSHICETFPLLANGRNWIEEIKEMTDSFAMRNLDGQLAYLNLYEDKLEGDIEAYFSPKVESKLELLKKNFPRVNFHNHKSLKKVYEKSYDIPWEVDVFKEKFKALEASIKSGDKIQIYGALSEDEAVRGKLKAELESYIEGLGGQLDRAEIVSAYKQGYSWIDEVVLGELKEEKIDRMEIYFKPFLREGETEWLDEDGATPSYHNVDAEDPDKWFDLPIRYLQELYPIDDAIELKLGLDREKVEFIAYEGDEDLTYLVKAYGSDEKLYESSYKASYSERPYLDKYPNMGKVHPSTGYIRVLINSEEVLNENIRTDLENIWDLYQKEVLEDCRQHIERRTGGNISEAAQPFFAELRLEVNASEPDINLPFRQDSISTLNSLHEDMYFVGTDYFKNYGVNEYGEMLDAPGLILPVLNNVEGAPEFKVTLFDQIKEEPSIEGAGEKIVSKIDRKEASLYMERLVMEAGKIKAVLRTDIDDDLVKSYMELLDRGILDASRDFANIDLLEIVTASNSYLAEIEEESGPVKDLSIEDINLYEDVLIGYDKYIEIIEQLKRVEGLEVYRVAESYLGRDIYAVEIAPRNKGYISRVKRINNYPTEFINSRHHANEVSSTNSAFMLIKKLLTDSKYRDLTEKMNLVIVPMENVDGTEIHYELQKDNPYWKFHVARFNAIGKEFYREHFDPDTIHIEAMGLTRLWEYYLPDIIVDNHGVPSHEWEQQFSGYTSPSYKGFWLPRSLLYGYFWTVKDEEYKDNYPVNKKIEEVIADKIEVDQEITSWNKEWVSRFEKYAHEWMPKLFPADYYRDMINYWIPFDFDPDHRYPSIRFPWITTVAYTSEVADETAQDEYLNLCARAHVLHDEAIIEMLMKAESVFEQEFEIKDHAISVKNIRHRPILV